MLQDSGNYVKSEKDVVMLMLYYVAKCNEP